MVLLLLLFNKVFVTEHFELIRIQLPTKKKCFFKTLHYISLVSLWLNRTPFSSDCRRINTMFLDFSPPSRTFSLIVIKVTLIGPNMVHRRWWPPAFWPNAKNTVMVFARNGDIRTDTTKRCTMCLQRSATCLMNTSTRGTRNGGDCPI